MDEVGFEFAAGRRYEAGVEHELGGEPTGQVDAVEVEPEAGGSLAPGCHLQPSIFTWTVDSNSHVLSPSLRELGSLVE